MPDKDCRTCKYGHYNDHWDLPFCYNNKECKEWELWEPKAQTYEENKNEF